MQSPGLALGWELWACNRLGLALTGCGVAIAAVLGQVLPDGPPVRTVGEITTVVSMFVFVYLQSVFVYGSNSLGGKAVGFPPRLFALPVRTSVLVGWPMLYGTTGVALGWLVLEVLVFIPCGVTHEMIWWPALLLAALVASFQAVSWTLVRSLLLRLVVVIVVVPSLLLLVLLYLGKHNIKLSLKEVSLCLCAVIAISYGLAVAGVARERRGDRMGWAWLGHLAARALPHLPRRRRPFASALAAQRWLECWRYGWLLPVFTSLFLLMLFWATTVPLSAGEVVQIVIAIVTVPVLLAFFVGFAMGKSSLWASDYRLSSFMATRPLTSAALGRAKLEAAGLSVAATWGLIVLLAPLWAIVSGNVEAVRQMYDGLARAYEPWKLALAIPATLAGMVGLTWLQMVGAMCLSLTGRPALVNTFALSCLAIVGTLIGLAVSASGNPDLLEPMLIILWCLGACLGLAKLGVAAWTWARPGWRDRTFSSLLIVWVLVAGCLLCALYTLVPQNPIPTNLIALFIVVALPLTRLAALPVAMAWNRHG
jgi:hypothetical protein